MEHKIKISVSKDPPRGIIACRKCRIRERILRFFFGEKRGVTVLIPGDTVSEIAICEKGEGQ